MMQIIVFLCVLMLCTFDFDVVTAVCQLLIKGYVMLLCYVIIAINTLYTLASTDATKISDCLG